MAIITKVSAQKRQGRYNIFLDQEYAFSVSEKTLAEFVLLKGQELSPRRSMKSWTMKPAPRPATWRPDTCPTSPGRSRK